MEYIYLCEITCIPSRPSDLQLAIHLKKLTISNRRCHFLCIATFVVNANMSSCFQTSQFPFTWFSSVSLEAFFHYSVSIPRQSVLLMQVFGQCLEIDSVPFNVCVAKSRKRNI